MYSLRELLNNSEEKYGLKLIAGKNGLEKRVNWVYPAEDIENINIIEKGKLIITTGYFTTAGVTLYEFIKALIDKEMSAVIINVGKYITQENTAEIKEICDKQDFPVWIMPWEVQITDIMQELCGRLIDVKQRREQLTEAFKLLIQGSDKWLDYSDAVGLGGFDINGEYTIAVLDADENAYNSAYGSGTHFFNYMGNIVLIYMGNEFEQVKKISGIYGVSSTAKNIFNLHQLYNQALKAYKAAKIMNEPFVYYENIGILSLLMEVKNNDVLKEYYKRYLGVLEQYDIQHHSHLIETLFYYLKTGGSLIETAGLLFTHRNTVCYRMNQIREIIGSKLDLPEERFDMLVALYVRKYIKGIEGE